jgi:hypothetical protein
MHPLAAATRVVSAPLVVWDRRSHLS